VLVPAEQFPDSRWATTGQADTAAVAPVAWSLTVDTNQFDPHNIHDAWNWRTTMRTLDMEKLVEFRRW
jgi:hypothetical protein